MSTPMISVLMPVYNGEKYLKEAIDSILNQTYTSFEFLILNDGSTDKTEEIILSYNDPRIIYIKNNQNLQIVKTLNKGIKLAKGKYIARMDADDISLPERFQKQVQFMEENSDIDLCGSWLETFYKDRITNVSRPKTFNDDIKVALLFNTSFMHPTVFGKKSFFSELFYNKNMVGAEDYELWIRGIDKYTYANIPLILLKYRRHANQTNTTEQTMIADQVRRNFLKRVCPTINENELKQFTKISSGKYVSKRNCRKIIKKILLENDRTNVLSDYTLKEHLDGYCWRAMNVRYIRIRNFTKKTLITMLGSNTIITIKRVLIRR